MDIAKEYNLLITGGSDYHGLGSSGISQRTSVGVDENILNRIEGYYREKKLKQ